MQRTDSECLIHKKITGKLYGFAVIYVSGMVFHLFGYGQNGDSLGEYNLGGCRDGSETRLYLKNNRPYQKTIRPYVNQLMPFQSQNISKSCFLKLNKRIM
jgi:hypothetical protein